MRSTSCWVRVALPTLLCLTFPLSSPAQSNPVLSVAPSAKANVTRGNVYEHKLTITVAPGFHVNSNTPKDDYLIPLKLTWNKGPLEAQQIRYPRPAREKYSFSDKPLSVFSGRFDIVTKFKGGAAASDMGVMTGKLRYQACNDKECLQPKTVPVQFSVVVH